MFFSILALSFASFMLILLSIQVIAGRRKHGVALGAEGPTDLTRRIRAQSNFAEYTPFFLLLLAANEYLGMHWALLLAGVIIFFTGRVMHAYSLLRDETYENGKITQTPKWRIFGMMCTFNMMGVFALSALVQIIIEKI